MVSFGVNPRIYNTIFHAVKKAKFFNEDLCRTQKNGAATTAPSLGYSSSDWQNSYADEIPAPIGTKNSNVRLSVDQHPYAERDRKHGDARQSDDKFPVHQTPHFFGMFTTQTLQKSLPERFFGLIPSVS